jgi:hypothetical protein
MKNYEVVQRCFELLEFFQNITLNPDTATRMNMYGTVPIDPDPHRWCIVKDSDPDPWKPKLNLKGKMKKKLCFEKLDVLSGGL